ncbi:uncharacterized protein LOC128282000 [Gossypium arboreum]|uniref:uncharacterized protein LOC128282000 n=1 Tax=Gossypium arboreum TaxID=29729 RepID=UPI0022F1DC58|nr:uncharacterized protein LOC128282000 [Gossypium arboreum]
MFLEPRRDRREPRSPSKGKGKKHTSIGSSSGRRSSSSNLGYNDSSTSTQGFYPPEQPSYFQPSHGYPQPYGYYPPFPNYGVPYQPQMHPPPPMYHPPPPLMYPPPQIYPPYQLYENQRENHRMFISSPSSKLSRNIEDLSRKDAGPTGATNRNVKRARMEEPVRTVPVNTVRPQACGDCARGGPSPSRGHGRGRGGNDHGRGAPGKGVVNIEARQPALVYAARRREEGDEADVITATFLISSIPYTALVDVGSTRSYVVCAISGSLEKAKIAEEVKQAERLNRDRDRNRFRRDAGPTGAANQNEHKIRDCSKRLAQAQVVEQKAVQPVQTARGGLSPSRGHGRGRSGNGHGRGAPARVLYI